MTQAELHDYLLSYPHVWLDFPFGDSTSVYKIGEKGSSDSKMFALVQHDKRPLQLSVKCDPQLAELLREKYETVVPGYHLNKKHWNTIICTGQVPDDELQDFIRLSYNLCLGP